MSNNEWMKDPAIANIAKEKLNFLQKLVFESEYLNEKEKMPFFLALANRSKQANIQFTEDEISRIINVLKKYSSPKEIAKMDQVLKMFHSRKPPFA